jgi:2-polyprenyl-6-hydroxyphenyl methylase/3-demethylubiquinone-9 3-methyltransferase
MSVDNDIYERMSDRWWGDDSFLTLLRTGLNRGRFAYFERVLCDRLALDPRALRVLDIGCGGGLLAEEFAKLGCKVTGIDPSTSSVAVAREHADRSRLAIEYVAGTGEALPFGDQSFDVAYCCDVLEHVADVERVIAETARVLRPGGVYLYDTINRTPESKLVAIKMLQDWSPTAIIPRGVHDWKRFIRPRELDRVLTRNGLAGMEITGLGPRASPWRLLKTILSLKRGKTTYAEAGAAFDVGVLSSTRQSYMGWALRTGGAVESGKGGA